MNQKTQIQLDNPRIINGWAMFDWANSSYSLTIATAIFPGYFSKIAPDTVQLGTWTISDSTLYAYAISIAYLTLVLASPLLSGIADYGGKKKFFMRMFTLVGSFACAGLFWFNDAHAVWWGMLGFILATIGYAGSLVFYNAYLPEIATEKEYDRVSAKGFSYGYFGSVILLIFNLLVIMKPHLFGLPPASESSLSVRLAFVTVGLWWIGFSQIPFNRLPNDPLNAPQNDLLQKGWSELVKVWGKVRKDNNLLRFLASFFFFNSGVQTVLFLASVFAEKELKFETAELIGLILILQIVAIGGAYIFAKVSDWKGNKFSIIFMLFLWIIICFTGYFIKEKGAFYILGGLVGLVMGGIQSLSRSTYSKLIPENTRDTTSFFSFLDVMDKMSVVVGTFAFGFVEQLTGDIRNSLLALGFLFIIGLLIMFSTTIKRAAV